MAQLPQVTSSVEHLNFMGENFVPIQNIGSLLLMGIFDVVECFHQVVWDALVAGDVAGEEPDLRHGEDVASPVAGRGEVWAPHVQRHQLLSVDQKVLLGSDGNRMGRVPVMFAYFDQTAGQNDLEIVVVNSSDHI